MGSGDDSRAEQVAAIATTFLALSTVAISLRCYCRVFLVRSFGLDDWFAVIAWLFFALFCSFALKGVHYGTGRHAVDIPPGNIPIGLKWWWACEPVYVLANMALKISIAIFLLRIAVARTHRLIIWGIVSVTTMYSAFYFFLFVLQCRPSAYFWTRYTGGKGTCIDPKITVDATYAYSAISCLADWILGIIPVFIVWNLQMNPRTKISVALILAVGAIASTATIIRIPYVHNLTNAADFLYATVDVAIWSTAETGIGITASALATLRPLFRNFFSKSKLMGSSTTPYAPNGTGGNTGSHNPWKSTTADGRRKIRDGSVSFGRGGRVEELALTSHAGKGLGVTTVVQSEGGKNSGRERTTVGALNFGADGTHHSRKVSDDGDGGEGGWGPGIRKASQGTSLSDEEEYWSGRSIIKTTASTQVVQ